MDSSSIKHGNFYPPIVFIAKLLFPKLVSYHKFQDTKQSKNCLSPQPRPYTSEALLLEPDGSLSQIHHPPMQLGQ